jgi:hypothetical protein
MSVNQATAIPPKQDFQCQVTCNYKIAKIIIPKPPLFNMKPPPNPFNFFNLSNLNDYDRKILHDNYQMYKQNKYQNNTCSNVKKYYLPAIDLGLNANEPNSTTTVYTTSFTNATHTKSFNESVLNSVKSGNSLIKDTNLFFILLLCCILLVTILVIFVLLYYYLNRFVHSLKSFPIFLCSKGFRTIIKYVKIYEILKREKSKFI